MPQSLQGFHFNSRKFGLIIKKMAQEKGISQASMAAQTGLSYDIVGNTYTGKTAKIPAEYVFKMCVVLGVSIEVIMMLMLKDEPVDFLDSVMLYDTTQNDVVAYPDVKPDLADGVVSDAVSGVAESAAQLSSPEEDAPNGYFTKEDVDEHVATVTKHLTSQLEHLKEVIRIMSEQHKAHLADTKECHARHVTDLKEQHENERKTADKYHQLLRESLIKTTQGG